MRQSWISKQRQCWNEVFSRNFRSDEGSSQIFLPFVCVSIFSQMIWHRSGDISCQSVRHVTIRSLRKGFGRCGYYLLHTCLCHIFSVAQSWREKIVWCDYCVSCCEELTVFFFHLHSFFFLRMCALARQIKVGDLFWVELQIDSNTFNLFCFGMKPHCNESKSSSRLC